MGMFDYVRCEVPLPDGFGGMLQTKDFDCAMSEVVIRADGTLAILRFEHEVVPQAERPYPDATDFRAVIGMLKRVNERWEPLDFHGVFDFYGEARDGPEEDRWHEYRAKFTDGRLVSITKANET